MPLYQLLTDRTLAQASAITPTTLIHIVTTGDTSQNSAGSSYKAELGQLVGLFSGNTFTGNTSATCINEFYVSDIYGCTGTTFHNQVCFDTIPTGTTGYTLSVNENGCLLIATGTTSKDIIADNVVVSDSFSGPRGNFSDYVRVSKIKSFSPLLINYGDEGDVYFGSTSGVTIDVLNSRIGIGTTTPTAKLDIFASSALTNTIRIRETGNAFNNLTIDNSGTTTIRTNGGGSAIQFSVVHNGGTENFRVRESGSISFRTANAFDNSSQMSINVGRDLTNGLNIGSLNVYDTPNTNRNLVGFTPGFAWGSGNNTGSTLNIAPTYNIIGGSTTALVRGIYYNPTLTSLSGTTHRAIETTTGDVIFGSTSGNVGIGTTTPSEKLDVSGKTKTINLQVTSGATTGYVLTSDASGNATWQLPTGGGTFTGGTVTGSTNFTNGLTASTISATTYQNLPTDVRVTGGTYSAGTITFTNNTGGTFNVTGLTTGSTSTISGDYLPLSGGTVTGTTTFTNGLTANTISATTIGNSGDCVDDLYVTNIRSCSPLNINPLNEGNVYFGSTSGVSIDLSNTRFGIGTSTPQFPFQIVGANSTFYYDPTSVGGRFNVSGNTNIPRYDVSIGAYLTRPATGGSVGMRSWNDVVYVGYGKVGDMHIYAGNEAYGLNIINGPGTNTEDYIRFYAGTDATSTSDIHIQGTGTTRGFVGLGIENPTAKLHVFGSTIVTGTLTATTVSATTYQNLPVSGLTAGTNIGLTNNNGNFTISVTGITGGSSINPFNDSGSGSTITWDVSGVSTNYEATLTATTTLNLINVRNGEYGTIIIKQDGVGGRTLTLGTVNGGAGTHRVVNGGGGSIVLTSNASATDILTFTYNGSVMYWTVGNDYT